MAALPTLLATNNAVSTLAGSITNVATTANLAVGTGVLFPNPGANQIYVGSFTDAATGLLTEIVHVTAMSSDTITAMVRAQEGTSALPWTAGDLFGCLVTAGSQITYFAQPGAVQQQAGNYVADSGAANAYAATLNPAVTAYAAGLTVRVLIANSSTGASTLNVNGLGAKAILKPSAAGPVALAGGELVATQVAEFLYDGTQFQLVSVYSTATVANARLNVWGGAAGGTANAITLTDTPVLTGFTAGQQVSFIASHSNTGATTVNPDGLGTKNLLKPASSGPIALTGGEIVTNNIVVMQYDGTQFQLLASFGAVGSVVATGVVSGLLPTSISTATLTVTAGSAPDSTGVTVMTLSGTTSWAVSNGNAVNGYQGGSTIPNGTTLHFFIISGISGTGTFASLSLTPTLPSGYTFYRRIFSLLTAASGNTLHASYQGAVANPIEGGAYEYLFSGTGVTDVNGASIASTASLLTLSLPAGIKVQWLGNMFNNVSAVSNSVRVSSPDQPDSALGGLTAASMVNVGGNGLGDQIPLFNWFRTNTSAQLRAKADGGTGTLYMETYGFIDPRAS